MNHETTDGRLTVYLEGQIDTGNAADTEAEICSIIDEEGPRSVVLNAKELDYISSAGLRVVMRLAKRFGDLSVADCNREVYDVFEMTGFTEMIDVRRALREVSIDGLELIGEGATAKVYRIDADTIVKVYNPGMNVTSIESDAERSRAAFVAGVPTAIAFDQVRVGECYGTVFELLNAEDLRAVMMRDREHMLDYVRRLAHQVRAMHQIEVDPTKFADALANIRAAVPRLVLAGFTDDETARMRRIFEVVPERRTFLHGDCHTGNVMLQNDELVFIDVANGGYGHPILDMASMCVIYLVGALNEPSRKRSIYTKDFTADECRKIWDAYLRAYLATDDEELIRRAERQILIFASARSLFAVLIPNLMQPERIRFLKGIVMGATDDEIVPPCFG